MLGPFGDKMLLVALREHSTIDEEQEKVERLHTELDAERSKVF